MANVEYYVKSCHIKAVKLLFSTKLAIQIVEIFSVPAVITVSN